MPNSTRINEQAAVEAVNLSANIPIKSYSDFSLSFALVATHVSDVARQTIIEEMKKILPEFQHSSSWGGNDVIYFSVSDKNKPGICRHLVKIFQDADVSVSAMGGNYTTPPYLDSFPKVENLPAELTNFANFRSAVGSIVNRALT